MRSLNRFVRLIAKDTRQGTPGNTEVAVLRGAQALCPGVGHGRQTIMRTHGLSFLKNGNQKRCRKFSSGLEFIPAGVRGVPWHIPETDAVSDIGCRLLVGAVASATGSVRFRHIHHWIAQLGRAAESPP